MEDVFDDESSHGSAPRTTHVVLLGDSIFDNAAYVAGGLDVVQHLGRALPAGCQASLLAVDGSVAEDVRHQLRHVPAGATHLAVSAGGNDALRAMSVLNSRVENVAEALSRLADIREAFEANYEAMLDAVLGTGLPTLSCTIYEPRFPDPEQKRIASVGLAIFNDVITRHVSRRGCSLLDLRLLVNQDADFANPIEPSVRGGAKIAGAIARLLRKTND